MKQSSNITLTVWLRLFWVFLKVNLLTTAGPTSVGLLYKETVGLGRFLTETQCLLDMPPAELLACLPLYWARSFLQL